MQKKSFLHINCKTIIWAIESFWIRGRYLLTRNLTRKLPESIKSSKFDSHRARMSGEFDSRKYSHSTKLEQRPWIFVKLSFRELYGSKLSGLHPLDNMVIIHWVKNRKVGCEFMRPILEVTFVAITENSSVRTNDTHGHWKYPHHWK